MFVINGILLTIAFIAFAEWRKHMQNVDPKNSGWITGIVAGLGAAFFNTIMSTSGM